MVCVNTQMNYLPSSCRQSGQLTRVRNVMKQLSNTRKHGKTFLRRAGIRLKVTNGHPIMYHSLLLVLLSSDHPEEFSSFPSIPSHSSCQDKTGSRAFLLALVAGTGCSLATDCVVYTAADRNLAAPSLCTDPQTPPWPLSLHIHQHSGEFCTRKILAEPAKDTCVTAHKTNTTYFQIKYHLLSQSLGVKAAFGP